MSVFLVLALVSQLVLWCVNCIVPGSALGRILAFLLCAGLPSFFVIKNQCLPLYSMLLLLLIIILLLLFQLNNNNINNNNNFR